MKAKKIVLVAMPGAHLLDVAGPGDVFSLANKVVQEAQGKAAPRYEIVLASGGRSKKIMTGTGIPLHCSLRVTDIGSPVDTLLIGGMSFAQSAAIDPGFADWLRTHQRRIRRTCSICVGAFMLAKAGLLNERRATTHWEYCEKLQYDYPQVQVDSSPFYVKDGPVYTSGGLSSGIDLSLALVEEDLGRAVALTVARKLVLHLRRPGSQLQYGRSLPPLELTSPLVSCLHPWLHEHLSEAIQVEDMAEQLNMSVRNFSRVFFKETGMTPAKYLEKMRLDTARSFLSETDLNIEQVAERCGLGSQVSMRRVFLRHLQQTPSSYRNHFRTSLVQAIA